MDLLYASYLCGGGRGGGGGGGVKREILKMCFSTLSMFLVLSVYYLRRS